MDQKRALTIILFLAVAGVVFSGTLTYQELFGPSAMSCPAFGAPGTVFGYPACVYGLGMYLIIAVVSFLGLRK